MRLPTLLLALLAALCACATASPRPELEVSSDGRSAVFRGKTWTAAEGIVFFQRGPTLHALSQVPEKPFDLVASASPDGELHWPADPHLQIGPDSLRWKVALATVGDRVAAGQLHPHEDHLHLTHLYDNADLQALYRAREENSGLDPVRRQVAATLVALLVEQKLPAHGDEAAAAGLARIDRVLARVHRGFSAGVSAPALADMLAHDFEILEDGRAVVVEDQRFRASDDLRFAYCSGHFHVQDAAGRWAAPVEFGEPGAPFRFPSSPLFAATEDGLVTSLPGPRPWRELLDSGQIQMVRDHWHLTARFSDPSLDRLRTLADNPSTPEPTRTKARNSAFALMRLKLDLSDGTAFEASLAAVRQAAAKALAALEPPLPAPAAAPAPEPKKASSSPKAKK